MCITSTSNFPKNSKTNPKADKIQASFIFGGVVKNVIFKINAFKFVEYNTANNSYGFSTAITYTDSKKINNIKNGRGKEKAIILSTLTSNSRGYLYTQRPFVR